MADTSAVMFRFSCVLKSHKDLTDSDLVLVAVVAVLAVTMMRFFISKPHCCCSGTRFQYQGTREEISSLLVQHSVH